MYCSTAQCTKLEHRVTQCIYESTVQAVGCSGVKKSAAQLILLQQWFWINLDEFDHEDEGAMGAKFANMKDFSIDIHIPCKKVPNAQLVATVGL